MVFNDQMLTKEIPVGMNQVVISLTITPKGKPLAMDVMTDINLVDGLSTPSGGWVNILSTRGINTIPILMGGTITIR